MSVRRSVGAVLLGVALADAALAGGTLHVDDDAAPGGDGSSWATAYRFLQDALGDASGGGVAEIRVGMGLYRPDRDESAPGGTGDTAATFLLIESVTLRGGFAGAGAPDPDERDIETYATVLSGDLAGDDAPGFVNVTDNSRHVLTGTGLALSSHLDGVIVEGGNSPDDGGGLLVTAGLVTIVDCTFRSNAALESGGGIACTSGTVDMMRCSFQDNLANQGGGVSSFKSTCEYVECAFLHNAGVGSGGRGGAVHSRQDGPTVITGCLFMYNSSDDGMGGIRALDGAGLTVTDSVFLNNITLDLSGGALGLAATPLTLHDCIFTGNFAQGKGGGVSCFGSPADLQGCIFTDNGGQEGGGFHYQGSDPTTIADCEFRSNGAVDGGGAWLQSTDAVIVDTVFEDNFATASGGGLWQEFGSASLTGCAFTGNHAMSGDGGGLIGDAAAVTIVHGVFEGNTASSQGGAARRTSTGALIARDSVFVGNTADQGGGLSISGNAATISSCTVAANVALTAGGGLRIPGLDVEIVQCVLWGNRDGGSDIERAQVFPDTPGSVAVDYSCIEDLRTIGGAGNIGDDPMFVAPPGDDDFGDLHLRAESPCVNAGDPAFTPEPGSIDLDGDDRVRECRVDIGFDETPFFSDCNDTGASDACEVAEGTSLDCNGNGEPDECDVEPDAIGDCDGNGVPDDCDPDCNGNGTPDACDLLDGASEDCNGNGVPDECDVIDEIAEDSGPLSPIGSGSPQSFTVVAPPVALGPVALSVSAVADLNAGSEQVDVFLNGGLVGTVFADGAGLCPAEPDVASLTLTAAQFNDAVNSGDAVLDMIATSSVNPGDCGRDNFIAIVVSYEASSPLDADGNGIPDTCECVGDVAQPPDGSVDVQDLVEVILQWGSDGGPADVDGDGTVDVQDLVLVVLNWGACP